MTSCATAKEDVHGDAHSNMVKGFDSVFKRGMKRIYQHCSEKHLNRYVTEFDFRYSNRSSWAWMTRRAP